MCTLCHTWAGHLHGYNNVLGSTFCTAYTIFHHQLNLSVQFWPPNVASSDSFLCYYDWMFFMKFAFVCSSMMAEWWHAFLTRLILGQLLAHACVWSRVSGLYQIHNFASWLGGSSKKLSLIQDLFWSLPWCLLCPLVNRQVWRKRRFQIFFQDVAQKTW